MKYLLNPPVAPPMGLRLLGGVFGLEAAGADSLAAWFATTLGATGAGGGRLFGGAAAAGTGAGRLAGAEAGAELWPGFLAAFGLVLVLILEGPSCAFTLKNPSGTWKKDNNSLK